MRTTHPHPIILLTILTALSPLVMLGGSVSRAQDAPLEALLLWDGETAGTEYHYGTADTVAPHAGMASFAGAPDKWHEAGLGLKGLPSWRLDISEYDELRFFARASVEGVVATAHIYGWPYFTKSVKLDPYIQGGKLTTEYRDVRIPIDALRTEKPVLERVEIIYFGATDPPAGFRIYIDDVRAVRDARDSRGQGGQDGADGPDPAEQTETGDASLITLPSQMESLARATLPNEIRGLSVKDATSFSVTLGWERISGAEEIRIAAGPEPPLIQGGELPLGAAVATLSGDANEYTIGPLAAGVDVFVRIEATSNGARVSGVIHARTVGGPRASLATPLRAVHAYGPNILMLVLANEGTEYKGKKLKRNTGAAWQKGPWGVARADGSAIEVVEVFRDSVPVSQPDYEVGFGKTYNDTVVDVDHRIFLALAEPIGSPEILSVSGPRELGFMLPFSDQYLETPVIQLNQVAYNPAAEARWAYVSGWMGDGGALPLSGFPQAADVLVESADPLAARAPAARGISLALRSAHDSDAGGEVREINLSSVPASDEAIYRVRIPGVGVSWPTRISEKASNESYRTIIRGLFYNRWGGDLAPAYTDNTYVRSPDHLIVYTSDKKEATAFHSARTPKTEQRTLAGGYHDAGDFDQRPMHVAVPELLMRAFEINRDAFSDGTLSIPESGNNIPDLLDEALWGIAGWEQLQEPSGGVRMGVESYRHPVGIYYAHQDELPYWTYGTDANHTARVAGLFAQASRLVAPYDQGRANRLLVRATSAYEYAAENGASNTNLLYASGELFRLTGDSRYENRFASSWESIGPYGAFSRFSEDQFYLGDYFNNDRTQPNYILGYLLSDTPLARLLDASDNQLSSQAEKAYQSVANTKHAHRSARKDNPDWGMGVVLGQFLDPIYARIQMGGLSADEAQKYFDAASLTMDYALGGNPDGRVYFTGMGSRPVQEPLHLDSLSFIKDGKGPIPGIPVFGPTRSLPSYEYYKPGAAAFYPAFADRPLMRRYADIRTFVVTNEFSVWEVQAPHAQLAALLASPSGSGNEATTLATATRVRPGSAPAPVGEADRIADFIAYGTPATQTLGVGERAGVIQSFTEAYGHAPQSDEDWVDVIKIANGRWPSRRNPEREGLAESRFEQIYLRPSSRDQEPDDAAIVIMSYGVRPPERNIAQEQSGLPLFTEIFNRMPDSAFDWDTIRAILHSGASR